MNPEPRAPRAFRSLSVKLVLRILMLGILLTILMTVAISAMRYEEEKKLAMEQLSSIARSHNASLANSLWDLDMQGLRLQLEAISQAQIIGQVLLSTSTGPDLVINKYESLPEMGSYHEQLFYTTTLHSPGHPDQAIGTLTLTVDPLTFFGAPGKRHPAHFAGRAGTRLFIQPAVHLADEPLRDAPSRCIGWQSGGAGAQLHESELCPGTPPARP